MDDFNYNEELTKKFPQLKPQMEREVGEIMDYYNNIRDEIKNRTSPEIFEYFLANFSLYFPVYDKSRVINFDELAQKVSDDYMVANTKPNQKSWFRVQTKPKSFLYVTSQLLQDTTNKLIQRYTLPSGYNRGGTKRRKYKKRRNRNLTHKKTSRRTRRKK